MDTEFIIILSSSIVLGKPFNLYYIYFLSGCHILFTFNLFKMVFYSTAIVDYSKRLTYHKFLFYNSFVIDRVLFLIFVLKNSSIVFLIYLFNGPTYLP